MILNSFRVTEFRSVQDSGWIEVEQITALIGTNESGKTNILLPLWKLNPADEGAINLKDDLPRDKYHIYRQKKPKPVFISAKYGLVPQEREALAKISKHSEEEFAEVIVSKDYDGNLYWEFPYEEELDKTVLLQKAKNILQKSEDALSIAQTNDQQCTKARLIIEDALAALNSSDDIVVALNSAVEILNNNEAKDTASVAYTTVKYSLQGTTQGNGLTGGLPPVRFSM